MSHRDWARLLALRAAAGPKQQLLAEYLCQHGLSGTPPTPEPTELHGHLAERQVAALLRLDLTILPIYTLPETLTAARPMPVALFVRGDPNLIVHPRRRATAIVGARLAGQPGRAWAQELAERLSRQGELVVSGGALGVDAAAHRGAVMARKPTLVFMGTPIDRAYPPANLPLFADVVQHGGALVSEHPPYARTYKSDHALRNRLIAAFAGRLVVVEAAVASGTLSAVRYARRLGTEVLVAPESVGGERAGLEHVVAQGWGRYYDAARDEPATFHKQ